MHNIISICRSWVNRQQLLRQSVIQCALCDCQQCKYITHDALHTSPSEACASYTYVWFSMECHASFHSSLSVFVLHMLLGTGHVYFYLEFYSRRGSIFERKKLLDYFSHQRRHLCYFSLHIHCIRMLVGICALMITGSVVKPRFSWLLKEKLFWNAIALFPASDVFCECTFQHYLQAKSLNLSGWRMILSSNNCDQITNYRSNW